MMLADRAGNEKRRMAAAWDIPCFPTNGTPTDTVIVSSPRDSDERYVVVGRLEES